MMMISSSCTSIFGLPQPPERHIVRSLRDADHVASSQIKGVSSSSLFARKDAQRGFTSEQRRIIGAYCCAQCPAKRPEWRQATRQDSSADQGEFFETASASLEEAFASSVANTPKSQRFSLSSRNSRRG